MSASPCSPPTLPDGHRCCSRESEAGTITVAFKKPKNAACTDIQQQFNRARNAVRAIGVGNSLLKTMFKAPRNVSLCPRWSIGWIAVAPVILHIEHGRTT